MFTYIKGFYISFWIYKRFVTIIKNKDESFRITLNHAFHRNDYLKFAAKFIEQRYLTENKLWVDLKAMETGVKIARKRLMINNYIMNKLGKIFPFTENRYLNYKDFDIPSNFDEIVVERSRLQKIED